MRNLRIWGVKVFAESQTTREWQTQDDTRSGDLAANAFSRDSSGPTFPETASASKRTSDEQNWVVDSNITVHHFFIYLHWWLHRKKWESSLGWPLQNVKWWTLRFLGSVLQVSPSKNFENQTHIIHLFQELCLYFCLLQLSMLKKMFLTQQLCFWLKSYMKLTCPFFTDSSIF